ncbi:MAG: hypothetical protein RLZZ255_722 [Cyanobacteriota bacterium]
MLVRTIIDLPEAERALLDAQCRQQGLSRAEAMRRALRLWLDQQLLIVRPCLGFGVIAQPTRCSFSRICVGNGSVDAVLPRHQHPH